MRVTSVIQRLQQHAYNLWHARDGHVAIIFGIVLIPLVGMVGAAVDYTRASKVKTAMQAALDAAALAVSQEAGSLSEAQLNEKATAFFLAALISRTPRTLRSRRLTRASENRWS